MYDNTTSGCRSWGLCRLSTIHLGDTWYRLPCAQAAVCRRNHWSSFNELQTSSDNAHSAMLVVLTTRSRWMTRGAHRQTDWHHCRTKYCIPIRDYYSIWWNCAKIRPSTIAICHQCLQSRDVPNTRFVFASVPNSVPNRHSHSTE